MNKLQEALKAMAPTADAETNEQGEEAAAGTVTKSEETEKTAASEAKGEDGGEGGDTNPLFDRAKSKQTVPMDRFNQVWKRAKAAESDAESSRGRVAELEGQVDGLDKIVGEVKERYSGNMGLLKSDQEFMNALEKEYNYDPAVAELVQRINAQTGNKAMANEKIDTPVAEETTTKTDPNIVALLKKDARKEVMAELEGFEVKPSFQKMIAKHIVDTADDLTDIDSNSILSKATAFIKDNDFTEAEVLLPKKEAPKTDSSPTPKLSADSEASEEAPKGREKETYQEMVERRERTMADFIKS